MAHLTGSRLYGKPTPDSDYDLVVRLTPEERDILIDCMDEALIPEDYEDHPADRFCTFRLGKLNLIVCLSDEVYEAWLKATKRCCKYAQHLGGELSREVAVRIHRSTCDEMGVCGGHPAAASEVEGERVPYGLET